MILLNEGAAVIFTYYTLSAQLFHFQPNLQAIECCFVDQTGPNTVLADSRIPE